MAKNLTASSRNRQVLRVREMGRSLQPANVKSWKNPDQPLNP